MNKNKLFCAGRDDDSWIFSVIIAIVVIMMIVALVVYGGAFIGGFYSIKNYILSFKENVVDSNRKIQATA